MRLNVRGLAHRGIFAVAGVGLLAVGFWWGHGNSAVPLGAEPPKAAPVAAIPQAQVDLKGVVAVITDSSTNTQVPITREEFGDYFINLYGSDRIDLFVNRRIIEMACAKRNIEVTQQEIDAQILEDCKSIGVNAKDYVHTVLRQRYGKTLDEWRQDTMRPRLLLAKLCRDRIPVSEEELKQIYENRYGKKVRCKIVIWPKKANPTGTDDSYRYAQREYAELRKGDKEFDAIALRQADAGIASRAGEIEPIGRFSAPQSAKMEEIAFSLEPGQLSAIHELPFGWVVVKCIGFVEPVKGIDFEKIKPELTKEVIDRKLEVEIPKIFAELRKEANVVRYLPSKAPATEEEIYRNTGTTPTKTAPKK